MTASLKQSRPPTAPGGGSRPHRDKEQAMDPTPTMVISTPCARRKGELEVSSVAEIDELIAALAVAKTGMLAAAAAIAAARVTEDERAEPEPGTQAYADKYASRAVQRELLGTEPGLPCDCGRRLPWPARGQRTLCPACGAIWAHDGIGIGAGARLEQLGKLPGNPVTAGEPGPPARTAPGDEDLYHGVVRNIEGLLEFCSLPPGHEHGCRNADGLVILTASQAAADGGELARPALKAVPDVEAPIHCGHRHPSKQTLCIGPDGHMPPCRDTAGDEWVPHLAEARS